jgi:hypothetical protein
LPLLRRGLARPRHRQLVARIFGRISDAACWQATPVVAAAPAEPDEGDDDARASPSRACQGLESALLLQAPPPPPPYEQVCNLLVDHSTSAPRDRLMYDSAAEAAHRGGGRRRGAVGPRRGVVCAHMSSGRTCPLRSAFARYRGTVTYFPDGLRVEVVWECGTCKSWVEKDAVRVWCAIKPPRWRTQHANMLPQASSHRGGFSFWGRTCRQRIAWCD